MKRRSFVGAVSGLAAVVLVPRLSYAQERSALRIGYLGTTTPEAMGYRIPAFKQGLAEAGFIDGKNVNIDYRWAGAKTAKALGVQLPPGVFARADEVIV